MKGFTLTELIVTTAIILILTSIVAIRYNVFVGQANIRVAVGELSSFILLAQEISNSSEVFEGGNNIGYQSVRIKVRDRILDSYQLEKHPGEYLTVDTDECESKSETNCICHGNDNYCEIFGNDNQSIKGINKKSIRSQDLYFTSFCFLKDEPFGNNECKESSITFTEWRYKNNFDIHIAIEQPTAEPFATVLPYISNKVSENLRVPSLDSLEYNDGHRGIRLLFGLEDGIYTRYIDVLSTGVVSYDVQDITSP